MGGRDKGLARLGSETMLGRAIERLKPQVGEVVVNANGDASAYAEFAVKVVADSIAGFAGPLAGILAGLAWTRANRAAASHVLTVPADTPFFPDDLVNRFLAALPAEPRILVARTEEGLHPVIGRWPVGVAAALEEALAGGLHKVSAFTEQQNAVEVLFPAVQIGGRSVDPFFNVNSPEDLAEAETLLRLAQSGVE